MSKLTPASPIGHSDRGKHIQLTKPINRPVLPPIPPSTFPTVEPTLVMAEPALDVTFDKPSEAFDAASEAFVFAVLAASAVVEALRNAVRGTEAN